MNGYTVLRDNLTGPGAPQLILLRKPLQGTYFVGFPLSPSKQPSDVSSDADTPKQSPVKDARHCSHLLSVLYKRHPFIWSAQDTVQSLAGGAIAVLPYPTGGSLHSFLFRRRQRREYLTEDQACSFFCQAVAAVHFLHSHNVAHGNISSQELLFVSEGGRRHLQLSLLEANACRVHYGSATGGITESPATSSMRTQPQQQSPEGEEAEDVRALGRILYELCCLELPPDVYCTSITTTKVGALSAQFGCAAGALIPRSSGGQPGVPEQDSWRKSTSVKQTSLFPPISQRYRPELAGLVRLLLLADDVALPSTRAILEQPCLSKWTGELLPQRDLVVQAAQGLTTLQGDCIRSQRSQESRSARVQRLCDVRINIAA